MRNDIFSYQRGVDKGCMLRFFNAVSGVNVTEQMVFRADFQDGLQ